MIKRLYNSWHIGDQGERSADKLFSDPGDDNDPHKPGSRKGPWGSNE